MLVKEYYVRFLFNIFLLKSNKYQTVFRCVCQKSYLFVFVYTFSSIKKLIAEKEYSKMYFSERLELGNKRLPEIVVS
jgi:hypothetical protein